jgi:small multidrug resistance family-3 protein
LRLAAPGWSGKPYANTQAGSGPDLGLIALGAYGFVATLQPDAQFGRILAAYGGVFVAGSLAWGMALDSFRPDRWDVIGALVCLAEVSVIVYPPRGH